jgi:hypothetical protein
LIDESFDQIDNAQERMDRIVQIVTDLCQQNLADFLKQCYTTCKYNQEHLFELRRKDRAEFPDRFLHFVSQHQ